MNYFFLGRPILTLAILSAVSNGYTYLRVTGSMPSVSILFMAVCTLSFVSVTIVSIVIPVIISTSKVSEKNKKKFIEIVIILLTKFRNGYIFNSSGVMTRWTRPNVAIEPIADCIAPFWPGDGFISRVQSVIGFFMGVGYDHCRGGKRVESF